MSTVVLKSTGYGLSLPKQRRCLVKDCDIGTWNVDSDYVVDGRWDCFNGRNKINTDATTVSNPMFWRKLLNKIWMNLRKRGLTIIPSALRRQAKGKLVKRYHTIPTTVSWRLGIFFEIRLSAGTHRLIALGSRTNEKIKQNIFFLVKSLKKCHIIIRYSNVTFVLKTAYLSHLMMWIHGE